MIACPSCQRPVEILDQHFGALFTCPHCQAVYFIDWQGQPEMAQHDNQDEPIVSEDVVEGSFENPVENSVESAEYTAPLDSGEPFAPDFVEPNYEAPIPEGEYMGPVETESYDFSQPLGQPEVNTFGNETTDSPDFSDITDFANADVELGPLSYTIQIDGLDSSANIIQLKEVMTDSRFSWDVSALLKGIKEGRLVLTGLPPAKASVLINRLKYLPFKISWRQDVLTSH